jgi:hypothetical protein
MKDIDAEFARLDGDPDEDYDSFEKSIVRSIDALDSLIMYLDDFIFDTANGLIGNGNIDSEFLKNMCSQKAVCISLRNSLREWGLGIPHHEVAKP